MTTTDVHAPGRDPHEVLAAMPSWGPPDRHLLTTADAATLMGAALVYQRRRRPSDGPYSPATFRSAVARAIAEDPDLDERSATPAPRPRRPCGTGRSSSTGSPRAPAPEPTARESSASRHPPVT